jgi:hypothetical protein
LTEVTKEDIDIALAGFFGGNEEPLSISYLSSVWGEPGKHLVWVTFMGKRLLWHEWAVKPLMNVQSALLKEGWDKKYAWTDLQTYNPRKIRGSSTSWSMHSGPLAIDINPSKNPYKKGALITDIPARVREIFKQNGFFWGGDWTSIKDAMHFEYVGKPVKEASAPTTDSTLLKEGSKGEQVTKLQNLLRGFGYQLKADGIFGSTTKAMVTSMQASRGLAKDGIVGPLTWNALSKADRVLKVGAKGSDVFWAQRILVRVGYKIEIDGIFGTNTAKAVKEFQGNKKISTDSIIGKDTWFQLRKASN